MKSIWKNLTYGPLLEMSQVVIRRCWCRETCIPGGQADWYPENPAFGQSDVTTGWLYLFLTKDLGVKDVRIIKGEIDGLTHWWLQLPDGVYVDFTDTVQTPDQISSSPRIIVEDTEAFFDHERKARIDLLREKGKQLFAEAEAHLKSLG